MVIIADLYPATNYNSVLMHTNIHKAFTIKVIAAVILTAISFLFLHSELGLFDFDGGRHGSHDYSLIVKDVESQSITCKDQHSKPDILQDSYIPCYLEIENGPIPIYSYGMDLNPIIKPSSTIRLFTQTFLI
jgi:hypothetical protein